MNRLGHCQYLLLITLLPLTLDWCAITTTAGNVSWDATQATIELLVNHYARDGRALTMQEFESMLHQVGIGHVRPTANSAATNNDKQQIKCTNQSTNRNPNNSFCNITFQCVPPSQLLDLVAPFDNVTTIDSHILFQLCPLLLTQVAQGTCASEYVYAPQRETNHKPSHLEVWGYGILFVTAISLCSLVGVSVLPVMGKKLYNRLLTFLIGLAVGSLSGSAVFHLLPQAFDLIPEGNEEHNYLWVSLVVMGGIYLFFMTERLMKIFMESRKRTLRQRLSHASSDNETLRCMQTTISDEYRRSLGDLSTNFAYTNGNVASKNKVHHDSHDAHNAVAACENVHVGHSHEHHIEFKQGQDSAIATVAWMIIFGDGLHNFIDGLSIGAGFNNSIMTGISISVAVLCEEFPHELGDFAVLLSSGMTMKQALLYNFLSACTCYLGLVVGILLGELTAASTYIFALASGMFLYISLVDMVPEMNEAAEAASKISISQGIKVLMIQNMGWLTGVFSLFILAYYNKDMSFV